MPAEAESNASSMVVTLGEVEAEPLGSGCSTRTVASKGASFVMTVLTLTTMLEALLSASAGMVSL